MVCVYFARRLKTVIIWYSGLENENTAVGIRHADHVAPLYPQKLALASLTSVGRSVGVVRSRTQATEFSFFLSFDIALRFLTPD
jgi:hypothetical protein